MAEPGDHRAPAARNRSRLRAPDANREQMIEVLKDAFVQGRLTKPELDARAGQALAARTYAEPVLTAIGILMVGVAISLEQRRSRGQLPPSAGPGGHAQVLRVTKDAGGGGAGSADVMVW